MDREDSCGSSSRLRSHGAADRRSPLPRVLSQQAVGSRRRTWRRWPALRSPACLSRWRPAIRQTSDRARNRRHDAGRRALFRRSRSSFSTVSAVIGLYAITGYRGALIPDIRQAGQFVKEIRVVLISALEPAPRQALAQRRLVPPPSFPQALEHVSVVFSPHPRHALADIQIERGRRNREGLLERLPCFLDPTGLA